MNKYPEVSPKTIWNFKQNNPELVVEDARQYIGLNEEQCELLRTILLARGVNKWLKVRRDLIAYKKQIKHQIKRVTEEIKAAKSLLRDDPQNQRIITQRIVLKETLKILEAVRGDLKALCMTDRWQIWRPSTSRRVLKEMNSITCSD
jgi:hypothetical protein